jgi:DNA-directed RNA polymerase subunit RPC12/RpoP
MTEWIKKNYSSRGDKTKKTDYIICPYCKEKIKSLEVKLTVPCLATADLAVDGVDNWHVHSNDLQEDAEENLYAGIGKQHFNCSACSTELAKTLKEAQALFGK